MNLTFLISVVGIYDSQHCTIQHVPIAVIRKDFTKDLKLMLRLGVFRAVTLGNVILSKIEITGILTLHSSTRHSHNIPFEARGTSL